MMREKSGHGTATVSQTLQEVQLLRRWATLSVGYLLLVALMGAFLRMMFVFPVSGVNYRYFLHAHSHVAFLGWVFNALLVGLLHAYLPGKAQSYRILFALFQVSVLGMLFSFPVQGYAAVSIAFSTLHIFLSWYFTYRFLRDCRERELFLGQHAASLTFMGWGLFFMVLSSVGPFALGAIMAKGLGHTHWYQLSIYFYLHFQYDGWFTFAVLGLFMWMLESNELSLPVQHLRRVAHLLGLACLAGYALSTLWVHPPDVVYGIAWIAVLGQLAAAGMLGVVLFNHWSSMRSLVSGWTGKLLLAAGIAFGMKVIIQSLSALPVIADLAVTVRNFTIGYLHLVFLGCVTPFLLAWLLQQRLLRFSWRQVKWGISLLLTGFIVTEAYLFGQPLVMMLDLGMVPAYFITLFGFSCLMVAGIGLMLFFRKT